MSSLAKIKLFEIYRQRISDALLFSGVLFILCWFLDYYITNISSGRDFTLEANVAARLWWQIMGPVRFIEFPIWIIIVFSTTLLINIRSKFLALLWLNFLAFQNLLGFLTWLPYGTLDFIYTLSQWATGYAISLISLAVSVPMTFLQTISKQNRF